ncbi:MAG: c-type cytochrome, partial [Gammaproteobacteria bacterium]
DFQRGKQVFASNCALCHGSHGQGTVQKGRNVFPPLWGKQSYNWGAGMHRINTAANFIHANMPLGKGGSLSIQQAWDVAYYINSHERPQDPRYKGSYKKTKKAFHQHECRYGDTINHHVLGKRP